MTETPKIEEVEDVKAEVKPVIDQPKSGKGKLAHYEDISRIKKIQNASRESIIQVGYQSSFIKNEWFVPNLSQTFFI